MFRKLLLSLFALFCFVLSFGAPSKVGEGKRIDRIEVEISGYRHAIDSLEYGQTCVMARLESAEAMIGHHMSAISNELSASDRFLTYFGIFLTILALVLGVYVTWMQNRVQKMSEQVASMEEDITKKRDEIVLIQNQINSGFDELFQRIRRADTASYVKRLEIVPMDVANIVDLLLARELAAEDFDVLKRAYVKLVEMGKEDVVRSFGGTSYGAKYKLLFFQFFPGRAIEDDFLRDRIWGSFSWLVKCCFENDIKKSMSDIAAVLHHTNVAFDRTSLLKDLLLALRGSEFKNNAEVFAILENGVADEELWKKANEMGEKEGK